MNKIPLAVVAGPTASGKTRLAVSLCKVFHGEVVSADSMQIYHGMQIATAKPTAEEMNGIPHHMIDFQSPQEPFSVADYVRLASEEIKNIHNAGHLPVLTGGTGLYIRSLLQGISYTQQNADASIRSQLEQQAETEGPQALHAELMKEDPGAAEKIHPHDIKRVIRALEMYRTTGKTQAENADASRQESPYRSCFLCLGFRDREKLYQRINERVGHMMQQGLLREAREVLQTDCATARQAIGYKELLPYMRGECSLQEAVASLKRETCRYAKRQMTWFRREKDARWLWVDDYETFEDLSQAAQTIIKNFLKGSSL